MERFASEPVETDPGQPDAEPVDVEAATQVLVDRLSRPHPSGGRVIERAAVLASGGDTHAVLRWITAHGGQPEAAAPTRKARSGMYSVGSSDAAPDTRQPLRYVLPPGV